MWRRVIDCLDLPVAIESQVAALAPQLDAVFGTFREAHATPVLSYQLQQNQWPEVVRDGEPFQRTDVVEDLVPAVELDLYTQVVARASGLPLHAGAVVGEGDRVLIFAGESGAGKSTLVRALLGHGLAYLTEECALLRQGGECLGLTRPLHAEAGESFDLPGVTRFDYPIRQGSSVSIKQLFHPPMERVHHGRAKTMAVVHISHAEGQAPVLEPLSAGIALSALWPMVFRPDAQSMDAATRALDGVALYRLRTSTVGQAVSAALRLAEELGVQR